MEPRRRPYDRPRITVKAAERNASRLRGEAVLALGVADQLPRVAISVLDIAHIVNESLTLQPVYTRAAVDRRSVDGRAAGGLAGRAAHASQIADVRTDRP